MKIKALTVLVLVSAVTLTLTVNPAFAGSRHNDYLKDIAIGVGAAIFVTAVLNSGDHHPPREPGYCPVAVSEPALKPHLKGYWEVRKEWISPIYRKVWNPGHYNLKGRWVKGAWIKVVDKPGYWKEKKVWVAANVSKHRRRH